MKKTLFCYTLIAANCLVIATGDVMFKARLNQSPSGDSTDEKCPTAKVKVASVASSRDDFRTSFSLRTFPTSATTS